MHPLLIALIFVVTTASSAIVAVKYTVKPKRQPAPAPRPSWEPLPRSIEGSMAFPDRVPASVPEQVGPKLLTLMTRTKQQQASALDHQVDEVIHRFILTS